MGEERQDGGQIPGSFGYVRQAVVNQHLSWLRRRLWREHPAGGTVELDQVVEQALGDPSAAADRRLALLGALRVLTRRERAILVLRHVEDLTERETAETLGVAVGTVKSANARALQKLRAVPELHGVQRGERV